jgi:hypothetical protein
MRVVSSEHAPCRLREQQKPLRSMHPLRRVDASVSRRSDACIGRPLARWTSVAIACVVLCGGRAGAQTTPEPPNEKKEKSPEPANEAVRAAKEGTESELPSVAGRPVRRYAQRNVLELGGAVSFIRANAFTQVGVTPTFGWFVMDYVQLSILPSVDYVKTFNSPAKGRYSGSIEPSFHISIAGPVFWFFGAGVGFAYEKDTGAGLAIAPRSGLNILIGGNGILKIAFAYVFTATKRTAIEDGSTEPHTSTFGLQMGCSVAW